MPAELVDGSLTSSLSELLPELRVGHQDVDFIGQITSELIRIDRFKGTLRHLPQRHQETGLSVHHYFLDSSHCAGDDRRFTSHRLKINNPKRFVNRGTAKNRCVGKQLKHRSFRSHCVHPNYPRPGSLSLFDGSVHFGSDLRSIWRPCAEHHLEARCEVTDRAYQVYNPFLSCDPTHE